MSRHWLGLALPAIAAFWLASAVIIFCSGLALGSNEVVTNLQIAGVDFAVTPAFTFGVFAVAAMAVGTVASFAARSAWHDRNWLGVIGLWMIFVFCVGWTYHLSQRYMQSNLIIAEKESTKTSSNQSNLSSSLMREMADAEGRLKAGKWQLLSAKAADRTDLKRFIAEAEADIERARVRISPQAVMTNAAGFATPMPYLDHLFATIVVLVSVIGPFAFISRRGRAEVPKLVTSIPVPMPMKAAAEAECEGTYVPIVAAANDSLARQMMSKHPPEMASQASQTTQVSAADPIPEAAVAVTHVAPPDTDAVENALNKKFEAENSHLNASQEFAAANLKNTNASDKGPVSAPLRRSFLHTVAGRPKVKNPRQQRRIVVCNESYLIVRTKQRPRFAVPLHRTDSQSRVNNPPLVKTNASGQVLSGRQQADQTIGIANDANSSFAHPNTHVSNCVFSHAFMFDEEKACDFLESIFWPYGAVCPHCDNGKRAFVNQGEPKTIKTYRCDGCCKEFTIKTGRFQHLDIPVHYWLQGLYLMISGKTFISNSHLSYVFGISATSAQCMFDCLRDAMRAGSPPTHKSQADGSAIVEADKPIIAAPKAEESMGGRRLKRVCPPVPTQGRQASSVSGDDRIGSTVQPTPSVEDAQGPEGVVTKKPATELRFLGSDEQRRRFYEVARGGASLSEREYYEAVIRVARGLRGAYRASVRFGSKDLHAAKSTPWLDRRNGLAREDGEGGLQRQCWKPRGS